MASKLDELLANHETQLLVDPVSLEDDDEENCQVGRILYRASFSEMEDKFVNYDTVHWVLLSLLLVLAWGAGIFMLLYLPMRRYITRRDFRSRKLYVTDNAVVYKSARPACFPCFGINRREKYLTLPLISDVIIEQGCLESYYGISSLRLEVAGYYKPSPNDDVQIRGLANPALFRKVVLMVAASIRGGKPVETENLHDTKQDSLDENIPPPRCSSSDWAWRQGPGLTSWQMDISSSKLQTENPRLISGKMIYDKLEGIENYLKKIQLLIEDQ